jgi:fructose-bisphosphate aldolase class I
MNKEELSKIAQAMVAPNKGILAADESNPTIEKRFIPIGVESTEENRRRYREILFTTEKVENFISGVILFDETLRQSTKDGVSFPKYLSDKGILPGIKVDKGAKPLALSNEEQVTEGLDGLRERLEEYRNLGAKFAKWRAVITIAGEFPSDYCIHVNAHALARYAALCQEATIVPIVEPEVLMDGGSMDHDLARSEEVTRKTLKEVFNQLEMQKVFLGGMILKPSMVIPGKKAAKVTPQAVAEATVKVYKETIPNEVPGCVFLSGGQSDVEATVHMNEVNKMGPLPWQVSFSYGRGLQAAVLEAWKGDEKNVPAAQAAFYKRAELNSMARMGKYSPEMENK